MTQKIVYFLLVVDDNLDFTPPGSFPNFNRLRLSDFKLNIPHNSGRLLEQPSVTAAINHVANTNKVAIIPFKPSAKIERLCQKYHWLYIANPAKINRLLEDKVHFTQIAAALHLPIIPNYTTPLNSQAITESQKRFETTQLVIQTHFGWAGQSTFQTTDNSIINTLIPEGTMVKIMPKLSGYTLLNNCCIYNHQLLQSPPALQFTGIPLLCSNPFTTVGRQWPSSAPENILDQIKTITNKLGNYLDQQFHYRGFFGLDFFITVNNQVYLMECNPRLTASYAFYTQLELKAGLIPLFYLHLDEFTQEHNYRHLQDRFHTPLSGTEITPKDTSGATIKKIHFDYPLTTNPHEITLPHL